VERGSQLSFKVHPISWVVTSNGKLVKMADGSAVASITIPVPTAFSKALGSRDAE